MLSSYPRIRTARFGRTTSACSMPELRQVPWRKKIDQRLDLNIAS